jgi:hypothetical protein
MIGVHGSDYFVDCVKANLEKYNLDVPFFIAGGCLLSTVKANSFYDIDVFFYNADDFNKVSNAISIYESIRTKYTITTSENSFAIQYINLHYGEIHEVLDTFDLTCCKIAIDSEKREYRSPDFDPINIVCDLSNFTAFTPERYYKYVKNKEMLDNNYTTLLSIIDHICKNFDEQPKHSYTSNGDMNTPNLQYIITSFGNKIVSQHVHDCVMKYFEPSAAIELFSEISEGMIHVENHSDEFIAGTILCFNNDMFGFGQQKVNEVKMKFAEYFI